MLNYAFTSEQSFLLFAGFLLMLAALWVFNSGRTKTAVFLLLGGAACLFSFSALLDPFLNLWDERFHALVAKNMMSHPLRPVIYNDPVVTMAYDRWDRTIIWLHKQPLFLWQSMLSFKLFGISEFTFRLPNIVLGVAFVYSIFRSGKLLVNESVGFYASLAAISTPYLLELLAGRNELDQNDFSFLCYVSLSIWTLIEYQFSGKKRWLILTGAFSGFAILCKWLAGLLVYAAWISYKLLNKKWRPGENKDLFISLGITILVALPWQLLILSWYPVEAKAEYVFSSSHFTSAIEGHRGTFFYYLIHFGAMYGTLIPFIILPGFGLLYKNSANRKLMASLLIMTGFLYLFFSIAVTKMPSFTVIGMPVIMLAIGAVLNFAADWIKLKIQNKTAGKIILICGVFLFVFLKTDLSELNENHSLKSEKNEYGRILVCNKQLFKSLHLAENAVLFNVKGRHYIEAMFYTGLPAYNFYPDKKTISELQSKGRKVVVFSSRENLPEEIRNEDLQLIEKEIKGYE